MVHTQFPVVIIGAGLAGLACAITLKRKGVPFLVLEKSDQVGGKLRTYQTSNGFKLDQGFQVLLTSYPELKHFVNLSKLDLKLFDSGALIYTPDGLKLLANPLLHPTHLLNESFSDLTSVKDKALVLKLVMQSHTQKPDTLKPTSTIDFLKSFGFSNNFIELFWRPFFAGVFLDPELETDAEYFLFLLKNFSTGRVGVPRLGMQQIPQQMLSQLPESGVRLSVDVVSYNSNEVILKSGERIKARAVVVANNPAHLNDDKEIKNKFRGVINYYFSTSNQLKWDKWLVLVPPQYGLNINNINVMSNISSAYSIDGQSLISASVVASEDPGEHIIAEEVKKIAGFDVKIKFINKYVIKNALPKRFSKSHTKIEDNIYYCGDYLSSPSINGALESGRITAEKIFSQNGNA